jgi:hypothetical protein
MRKNSHHYSFWEICTLADTCVATAFVKALHNNYGHYWHLPQQMFTLPQSAPKHKRQTLIGLPLV